MITAQNITVIPADWFVESIGVNTHWENPNVYTQNYTGLKGKLAESGIRYVRDGTYQATYIRANDLYNNLGIRTNILTGRRKSGPAVQPLDPTKLDEELNEIKTQALLAATVSLEAPNEYDVSHGPDTDWVGNIKNYSILLYIKAKADEKLRNLPMIGPSLTSLEAYEAVGNFDQYIDYANLHMYQSTYWPGNEGWDKKNGSPSITWYLNELARQQSPSGKRVQTTEAGYHNDIQNGGLSEEAEGKYTARIFAEFFRRGIYRTYRYELVNEGQPGSEGIYGLLRHDLSEKPSFRAVKNLITILSDKGPDFEPGILNYTLNGSMDNVRQILFQKRDGDFYLMLWMEVSSWNLSAKIDLYPPPQQVLLTLQDSLIISDIPMITAQNVTAIPADSFVESIGVNTHWAYPNVYLHNYTGLKAKLAESGIRYVRDGTFPEVFARANDLYDSLGIKTNMLTGRYKRGLLGSPLDPTQIDAELNEIKTQALAATVSLEAPNEYDLEHGPDTDWVANIKNYSILLYTKAKADEMLRHLPVIGPSLTSLEAYEAVGNSDQYIDYGNQHMYQWSYWPDFNGYDKNGSRSITWYLDVLARVQSPSGKLVQGTETGHSNYIQLGGLSEEADGKYMARIFAEFFRRGIYRTYKYELVSQGQPGKEGVFGLLRNDLSEKPSFRAVKNLIAILSDKGPNFQPGTLNYTLNGSMDNVRQILFQKRNGDFYLMLWLEVSSWDVNHNIDLYPPPQQVVLTLQDSKRISSATLYAFNNTADVSTANLIINNNQVTFNATDKISIIKLSNSTNWISHSVYRLIPKTGLHSYTGI